MYNMQERMLSCNYCGSLNAFRHPHYKNRCVDCGKLYDRFKKAQRRGIQSELILCSDKLLQRGKHASITLQKSFYKNIADATKHIKEECKVSETHKTCKQCGRYLPIEDFRKYVPRGNGIYKTTQGRNTICRTCEAISSRASTALSKGDSATIQKLAEHYRVLQSRGYEPVTAPAKRLLGVDTTVDRARRDTLDEMLSMTQGAYETEIDKHCRLVRQRGYASAEDADEAHRRLADELRTANYDLYEEITELVDEWYMEG